MKKYTVLLIALCGLGACDKKENFSPEENTGVQIANQVSIFESKGSQQQWLLTAEAVDFADLTKSTLKNPILLLKKDNKDSVRVTGQSGSFDYEKKLIAIEGNAVIHSLTEQVVIATERFFYDIDKDLVWSDLKTTVTRGEAKAVARGGIETDSKLAHIKLKQQTTRIPTHIDELKRPS